jgi:TolB protein
MNTHTSLPLLWCTRVLAAALVALAITGGAAVAVAQSALFGDFEASTDVGAPRLAGSATYNAVSQHYRLSAAGVNMWGPKDEFHFAWKRLKGDFILQARLQLVGTGTDPHRKAGVIVRTSLDADAPYADGAVHGDGLVSLQFRRTKGSQTEESRSQLTGADFVRLERKGSTLTLSVARFGDMLTTNQVEGLELGDDVYVGLFVCSHNPDVVESAVFRDVRLVRPVREGFVPYRDYIGSRLEILDVGTGDAQVVHSSAEPFEAPNWTRDGRALIYNTSGRSEGRGRLHRFDLATRQSSVIDTGTAVQNNNDHVLSFDGASLGISNQSAPDGQSVVYTLPSSGGTPRRITRKAPSYFHGWSPDGKTLVYTGGRNGEFDIYRIAADGQGEETNLTRSPGLDDGPEYTPDGRYVYFNSTRSGTMQIWRMKPDGADPEQVTNDEHNNWFPHVSPDGKWIVFITFPKEVPPADHPYYQRVTLRLMPIEGGAPRVIAYLYGGQGTINVPSWSPDGTMLAFVSNTGME